VPQTGGREVVVQRGADRCNRSIIIMMMVPPAG
jgi:hypothetical protein